MPEQYAVIVDFDNMAVQQQKTYGRSAVVVVRALRRVIDEYQKRHNAREVAAEILNDFVWSAKHPQVAYFHRWAADLGFVLIHCPPLQNGDGIRDSVDDHVKDRLEFYHDNFGSDLTIILAACDGNFIQTANNLKRRRGHRLVLLQNRDQRSNALSALADEVIYLEYGDTGNASKQVGSQQKTDQTACGQGTKRDRLSRRGQVWTNFIKNPADHIESLVDGDLEWIVGLLEQLVILYPESGNPAHGFVSIAKHLQKNKPDNDHRSGEDVRAFLQALVDNQVLCKGLLNRPRKHHLSIVWNHPLLKWYKDYLLSQADDDDQDEKDTPDPDATDTISDSKCSPATPEVPQKRTEQPRTRPIRPRAPEPRPGPEDQDVTLEVIRGQIWPRLYNPEKPEGDFQTRILSIRADFPEEDGQKAIQTSLDAVLAVARLQRNRGQQILSFNMVLDAMLGSTKINWERPFLMTAVGEMERHDIIESAPHDPSHSYRLNKHHPLVKHLT